MSFGQQLFESGFLSFADTLILDSVKSALIDSFDIYNAGNNKIAHIDAEELAEFSFNLFLPRLNRILERRGFKLNVKTADNYESSNEVIINGERTRLYTKEELKNGNFWESAAKNFFKKINKQLNSQKISESFYLLYGGNDLHVLLLTKKQYKIITDKYKGEINEIPYLP